MPLTTFCSQIMTKKHNFSRELIWTACQWYDFINSDLEPGKGKKKEKRKKEVKEMWHLNTISLIFNWKMLSGNTRHCRVSHYTLCEV